MLAVNLNHSIQRLGGLVTANAKIDICKLPPDAAVKTYYLEMLSPDDLNGKPPVQNLRIVERKSRDFEFNKRLYALVGQQWQWLDKLSWSEEQWKAYAEAPGLLTHVAYFEGALAGYYELQEHAGGDVEITYFGLLPDFIGRGLGGYLLTSAIQFAWGTGASRVWVHTCSLDHPGALANYQARGMRLYKTETS